jgi:formylglycine-generating enzyme required for sulfatase activity
LKELSSPGEDAILTVEELIAGLKNTQPEPKAFTFGTHQLDGNFLFILNQSEKKANSNPDEIDRVIESSLIEAEHLIRNLDYDRAWYRLKGVKDLKKPQQEITKLLLEIAFWNAESSKYDRAEEILRAIADPLLLSNSPILDSLRFSSNFEPTARLFYLRRLIRSLDKIHFEQLLNRYYPTMIRVKGGEFQVGNVMGDNAIKILRAGKVPENSYRIDSTRLRDTLYRFSVRDFELAKTETTIWQWSIFCASTGKNVIQYVNSGSTDSGNLPAAKLSWHEAVEYANWLSGRLPLNAPIAPFFKINGNKVDTIHESKGFRLPSEEEWEYAAREGGKKIRYGNGSNIADPKNMNFDCRLVATNALTGDFKGQASPVGTFEPNKLGLYDMSGNLREWCLNYKATGRNSLPGPESRGPNRSDYWCYVRGGAWNLNALHANVSLRYYGLHSNLKLDNIGFRIARSQ